MKCPRKVVSIFLSVIAMITCILPTTAFAASNNVSVDNSNNAFYYSIEESEEVAYASYEINSMARATGLITKNNLYITKNGTTLSIGGVTTCTSDIVKCGFKEVVIERRKNSSSSWSEYKVYEDLYSSSSSYTLKKSVTVPSGYQYRVTAIHYAKKSLLSTQKIEAVTGYLSF